MNLVKVARQLAIAGSISYGLSWFAVIPEQAAGAAELKVSESQGVNLTIYNQNFGLVKDIREIELEKGVNYVRFEDVAERIDPTSVSFSSLTAPNAVVVREQNYQFDVMAPETILAKSVGKTLTFRRYLDTGGIAEVTGKLLNSPVVTVSDSSGQTMTRHQQLVVQTESDVVLNPGGEVHLQSLPAGLVSKPSLLWKLDTVKAGRHKTEIAYQTQGLNWKCDYVALLNEDDTKTDLTSWVTIDNKCGATFKAASLKLLAGDVHKVQPQPVGGGMRRMMAKGRGAGGEQFKEQAFAEYHLYTLQGKTNVNQNETKQLTLFNAAGTGSKKLFVFEPDKSPYYQPNRRTDTQKQKVNVKIEIENKKDNNLGMPMPKGKVRVYKRDEDGALQFVGEDLIDHTPRDEKFRLYIGDAFDIVGEKKQTTYQKVSSNVYLMGYEISLRNHKDEAVTIDSVEHAGGDWKILNSSHEYKKKDSRTFEFEVKVPARGEAKINYEIQVRY